MKTRTLAANLLARTAIIALVAVTAAFFAGCGDGDEDDDEKSEEKGGKVDLGKSDEELSIGMSYLNLANQMSRENSKDGARLRKKAFEYIEKSAKHGNMDAMYLTATYYLEAEDDEDEALKWAEKAEENGQKAAKDLVKKLEGSKKARSGKKKSYDEDDEYDEDEDY